MKLGYVHITYLGQVLIVRPLILPCVNKIQKGLQNHISEEWSMNVTNHYITLLTHKACHLFGIIFDSHKRELLKFIVNVTSQ